MRVTKIIKEYVEKSVREAVYKKYEHEKALAEVQSNILSNIEEKAEMLALQAAIAYIEKETANKDYIEVNDLSKMSLYMCRAIEIKDRMNISSVHNWKRRADNEVKEKVEEILVTCELGGTKAKLDEMLRNI